MKKCEHEIKGYERSLAQIQKARGDQERWEVKLNETREQHVAWSQRLQVLQQMVVLVKEQVKAISAGKKTQMD